MRARGAGLIIAAVVVAGVAVGVALAAVAAGARLAYRDRVLPRVAVLGMDVGGLSAAEVAARLDGPLLAAGRTLTLTLVGPGAEEWILTGAELGLAGDLEATVEAAMAAGRESLPSTVGILAVGRRVRPVFAADMELARAALAPVVAALTVSPVNARLETVGDEVVTVEARLGTGVDIESTVAALIEAAGQGSGARASVQTTLVAPRIGSLENVADAYAMITSSDITLQVLGAPVGMLSALQLQAMVTIEELPRADGDTIPAIVFDRERIRQWVVQLAPQVDRPAIEGRFRLDPTTRLVSVTEPGQRGLTLDPDQSVDRVIEAAYTPQRVGELAVIQEFPLAEARSVDELQGMIEFAFGHASVAGMPPGRLQNMAAAGASLTGVAVPPGAELSVLRYLPRPSAEAGYDMGQFTAPLSGEAYLDGGVGELVTALYRAAFWGGLAVVERHPLPFRLGFLEPPVGLDATVHHESGRDLVIANDTGGWLMVATEALPDAPSFRVSLLGTRPPEREVRVAGPVVTGIGAPAALPRDATPPAPSPLPNAGWAREAAAVSLQRIVLDAGSLHLHETLESRYRAATDQAASSP